MAQQETIDLVNLLTVLRRQFRLIALSALVVLALALVYVTRATPQYTAAALIKIDPVERDLLTPGNSGAGANAALDSTRIETEVEILRSDQLLLKTIDTLSLLETPEFGPGLSLMDQAKSLFGIEPPLPEGGALLSGTLSRLRDSISIRRSGLTYIVRVQATSPNAAQSAEIANTHAQTYIDDQVTARLGGVLAARDVLQGQLESAQDRLTGSSAALRSYVEDNVLRLARESNNEALEEIGLQLQQATGEATRLQSVAEMARSAAQDEDWATLADTLGDTALAALDRQRQGLAQRLGNLEAGSVEAIDLQSSLDDLESRLRQRSQDALSSVSANIQRFQDSRLSLLDTAQEQVLETALSADALSEIYALQQEATIAQRQYDQLLVRIRDLEAQAAVQVASSRIVSQALVPVQPSYPNKKLVLALALVLGTGLGIGLALLKEFVFGGITSANQLGNVVDAPVGGVVPKVATITGEKALSDRVKHEPMSRFSEEFRKLRAMVDLQLRASPDEGGRTILMTSALPAEGKSTSALSLARTYAMAGKRVLLVDCDLRNPSVGELVGMAPKAGLMDYLLQTETAPAPGEEPEPMHFDQFYVEDPLSSAYLVLGRRIANVPTDAPLQSRAFSDLIVNARKSFDIVILDSAPLIPVVDTRYVAPKADVAVLCVRFSEASQAEMRSAVGLLHDNLRPESSIVTMLNCFEGNRRGSEYNSYYG